MLSEEQLKEIEELAGYFFTEEEVAEITGIGPEANGFKKAFRRGSLKAEAELRKVIIKTAMDGSSPAQTMAWKMVETQKRNDY